MKEYAADLTDGAGAKRCRVALTRAANRLCQRYERARREVKSTNAVIARAAAVELEDLGPRLTTMRRILERLGEQQEARRAD
jgi:predicted transcriptional regulator